jgi:hypothetical protein
VFTRTLQRAASGPDKYIVRLHTAVTGDNKIVWRGAALFVLLVRRKGVACGKYGREEKYISDFALKREKTSWNI